MKKLLIAAAMGVLVVALVAAQTELLRQSNELTSTDIKYENGAPIDWYSVNVHANTVVSVRVASVDFAPTVVTQFADRASDTREGKSGSVGVSYSVTQPQTLRIGVTAGKALTGTASYIVRVMEGPQPAPLAMGVSRTGDLAFDDQLLEDGRYVDTYPLSISGGKWYGISMASDEFDSYITVELPDGRTLENDDAGDNTSALRFFAPQSGTATVSATSYSSEEVGTYSIKVVAIPGPTNVTIGQTVSGSLATTDDMLAGQPTDTFVLHGKSGDAVVITAHSDAFDAYLRTLDADGAADENDDMSDSTYDAQISYTFPSDGDLQIEISSVNSDEMGAYQLSIAPEDSGN